MEIRQNEKAAASYRTLRLLGLGQVGALVLYGLLVELLASAGVNPTHPVANVDLVRGVLLLVSVVIFFAAGRLRHRMLEPALNSFEQALVPGERLKRMMAANIVVFALCDAAALFGLVLFFLGGGRQDFYLFLILALLFTAARFPGAAQWQAWYAARGRLR